MSVLSLDAFGVFEVLATNGDTFLGGEDVDSAIAKHLTQEFVQQHALKDTDLDSTATQRIKEAAERAKISLDLVSIRALCVCVCVCKYVRGCVVIKEPEHTHRQTDRHTHRNAQALTHVHTYIA